MTTRSVTTVAPVLQQEIEITQNTATTHLHTNLTTNASVLSFRELFP